MTIGMRLISVIGITKTPPSQNSMLMTLCWLRMENAKSVSNGNCKFMINTIRIVYLYGRSRYATIFLLYCSGRLRTRRTMFEPRNIYIILNSI